MRLSLAALLALSIAGLPCFAAAEGLKEALAQAYMTSPDLRAARAELRAVDEQVPQARSGYLPSVTASGSVDQTFESTDPSNFTQGVVERNGRSVNVQLTQPLYRGGRTMAAVRQAKLQVRAQRAILRSVEQQLLLDGVTAYMDVVADQAVLELNINNENVLSRQLEAAQDRFRVGEVTRTDVSQAESRLAGALASRVQAAGDLQSSIAQYESTIGTIPGQVTQPELDVVLPQTRQQAIDIALDRNPDLEAARAQEAAAREGIDLAFGEFLPTLDLVGQSSRSFDGSPFFDSQRTDRIVAQVNIPLYQAGSVSAQTRSAKQSASQALADVEAAMRVVRENVIAAWEQLQSVRASIEAFEAQVVASEIALEGVRQEAMVGSRTTLDILDAEQEFLNAQVDLVTAKRNEVVAVFTLLSAIGQLNAKQLDLAVDVYDPNAYYERVDGKIFGTGID